MRAFLIAIAFALCGCTGTGILPAGPDTYTITKQASPYIGGQTEAEKEALTEANKSCQDKGLTFVPSTMGPSSNIGYSVTFRCLQPNDPAVAKYQLGQAPNVIVEQRSR